MKRAILILLIGFATATCQAHGKAHAPPGVEKFYAVSDHQAIAIQAMDLELPAANEIALPEVRTPLLPQFAIQTRCPENDVSRLCNKTYGLNLQSGNNGYRGFNTLIRRL
jgi:hypothetical protein